MVGCWVLVKPVGLAVRNVLWTEVVWLEDVRCAGWFGFSHAECETVNWR